jgi:hypothetical protein
MYQFLFLAEGGRGRQKLKTKIVKTMDKSHPHTSAHQSCSCHERQPPPPLPPQCSASNLTTCAIGTVGDRRTTGGKAVNLPPSGAAQTRQQMGCVSGGSAVAAEAEQREQGRSSTATVGSVVAESAMQGQQRQRGGSRAVFAGARRQLSGSDERGGRVAGHWRQLLQQSGGSGGSTATAASAQGRQRQHRDGARAAGWRHQWGGSRVVLAAAARWQ